MALGRVGLLVASLAAGALAVPGVSAATTFTVNTVDDLNDGSCDVLHCTLREAINAANADADGDDIHFDILGPPPHTIMPLEPLPHIGSPVDIDATSEPDYAGSPVVEVDGTLAGGSQVSGVGFLIGASDTAIRGLALHSFTGDGIRMSHGARNVVEKNYIGTDITGTADRGNTRSGIFLRSMTTTRIGGFAENRNVISGNDLAGVELEDTPGSPSADVRIAGNYVGTTAAGDAPLPNNRGIELRPLESPTGLVIVGATGQGKGNLISGNTFVGLLLGGDGGTFVQGNLVGTDATGTAALGGPRQPFGVSVRSSGNNLPNNVISANDVGVHLLGASGNIVHSNWIGTDEAGTADLGNTSQGVLIEGSSDNFFGFEAGNTIAFNGTGVSIRSGTGNRVIANSVFSNDGLGIDLSAGLEDGVTPNDPGDGDSGGNELQNFPDLTSATHDGNGTATITGSLDSKPNTTYQIVFSENTACDPSGHGEGQFSLGGVNVTTDGNGHADFNFLAGFGGSGGFTAIANDPDDNGSEFSNCIEPTAAPQECTDGIDNDGDGRVDFPRDKGCKSAADPSERMDCDDGVDNDGDGLVDRGEDPGCSSRKDKTEAAQCEDGVDNDGDGDVDFPADPGCRSAVDNKEKTQCDDGRDNDGDGATDFPDDPGCLSRADNSEKSA